MKTGILGSTQSKNGSGVINKIGPSYDHSYHLNFKSTSPTCLVSNPAVRTHKRLLL